MGHVKAVPEGQKGIGSHRQHALRLHCLRLLHSQTGGHRAIALPSANAHRALASSQHNCVGANKANNAPGKHQAFHRFLINRALCFKQTIDISIAVSGLQQKPARHRAQLAARRRRHSG